MKIKKRAAAALLAALMLSAQCTGVFAETQITKLTFGYPNGWEYTEKEEGYVFYQPSGTGIINVYNTDLPDFDIMSADKADIENYLLYTNAKTGLAALSAVFDVSEVVFDDIDTFTEMKNTLVYRAAVLTAHTGGGKKISLISYMCTSNGVVYHFDLITDNADERSALDDILDSALYTGDDVPQSNVDADIVNISVNINGRRIRPDSPPELVSGRTLVPIRAVAENLGYTVGWDAETRTVEMTQNGGNEIKIAIDADYLYKNGEKTAIDVPAQIIGSRTYLPLRAVAEAMDCRVEWDGENKIVDIYS
ncbi:MAG: copper amine oxidase N-terminal domain-containing protein [Firmicutes bacterium]|nr:copper amine oxidase N-terminal domain-containing protein [Bacillota bacterium]